MKLSLPTSGLSTKDACTSAITGQSKDCWPARIDPSSIRQESIQRRAALSVTPSLSTARFGPCQITGPPAISPDEITLGLFTAISITSQRVVIGSPFERGLEPPETDGLTVVVGRGPVGRSQTNERTTSPRAPHH